MNQRTGRTQAYEVELLAERHVERAEAAAHRRGERSLDGDEVRAMASRVSSGSQLLSWFLAFSPASTSSQAIRRFPRRLWLTAPSNTRWEARQMSGPVPSPSMKGMTGRGGTSRRPLRSVMASPSTEAGGGCVAVRVADIGLILVAGMIDFCFGVAAI